MIKKHCHRQKNNTLYCTLKQVISPRRHKGGGGEGINLTHPLDFLAVNFCSLTDYQKLWHNCSLFVKTSFDPN